MSFTNIDITHDFAGKGAMSLANQPTEAPEELKRKFDEPSREVVAPAVNRLISELEDPTSASSLGATAPTGRTVTSQTVQAGLNKLSTDLTTLEGSVSQAIEDAHTHANKDELDTLTSEKLAGYDGAVANSHSHSNKSDLDSITAQKLSDYDDAVAVAHSHTNKALLDDYTQTDADITDAVTKKHTHSNKTVIDKFGESGGKPTYDGQPIGGGGSGDTFKTIVGGGQSFVASGEDTFKINAGSNVTIEALTGSDKGIKISASGGGSSTGDMLMSQYDNSGDVKNASNTGNGIKDFVASEIGKLDVSDSAVSGKYVSAVSETDGKISVTRESLPSIPTITDTYSASSHEGMSGVAVASAISGKADTSSLGDLAFIDTDGASSTKVLQGDGTWVTPSSGGHTMIDNDTYEEDIIAVANDDTDDEVVSAYGIANWSNCDAVALIAQVNQGDDGVGTWLDDASWESGTRSGWLWSPYLYQVLEKEVNNVTVSVLDKELIPIFDVDNSEAVSLYAYRIDDNYPQIIDGATVNGGCIALKFNGTVKSQTLNVGVKIVHQKTKVLNFTVLS